MRHSQPVLRKRPSAGRLQQSFRTGFAIDH